MPQVERENGLSQVTGRGLTSLTTSDLRELNLHNSRVDDEGLKSLRRFKRLAVLNLGRTSISDGALSALHELNHLERLVLHETPITVWGVHDFERKTTSPSLKIEAPPRALRTSIQREKFAS